MPQESHNPTKTIRSPRNSKCRPVNRSLVVIVNRYEIEAGSEGSEVGVDIVSLYFEAGVLIRRGGIEGLPIQTSNVYMRSSWRGSEQGVWMMVVGIKPRKRPRNLQRAEALNVKFEVLCHARLIFHVRSDNQ